MNRYNILKAERAYRVKRVKDVDEMMQCVDEIEANDNDQPL
jgi:hypothetical protein